MQTFLIPTTDIQDKTVLLTGENAHHLSRALRAKEGERVRISSPDGKLFEAQVASIGKEVKLNILQEIPAPSSPYPIHLYLALLKSEKMEWVIQKAVELNVEAVHLVITQNSVRQELSESKWNRIQKIAEEAQKQCGRITPLKIFPSVPFQKALDSSSTKINFFACEKGSPEPLKAAFKKRPPPPFSIWIGPEGGWDDHEISLAKASGYHCVGLGPFILRSETAALHALSCLIYSL